jgi:hypothetical protein
MRTWPIFLSSGATLVTVALLASEAKAQLHFDVGAEPGVMRRILLQRGNDGFNPLPDAGFGPMFELHGHVAILPLLRAGLYVSHDISSELSARQITSFGVRAKLTPPLLCGNWRSWAFVGFGYSLVYAPSFQHDYLIGTGFGGTQQATTVSVDGQSGYFFEVPVGIGLGYKLDKTWELTAELGAKVGFNFSGDLYCDGSSDPTCAANGSAPRYPPLELPVPGYDTLAVYLALGVSLDL